MNLSKERREEALQGVLSAEKLKGMVGPDTPDCECENCQHVRAVKALICEQVTDFETKLRASGDPVAVWLTVLFIAASRVAVSGIRGQEALKALMTGGELGIEKNPLLVPDGCEGSA